MVEVITVFAFLAVGIGIGFFAAINLYSFKTEDDDVFTTEEICAIKKYVTTRKKVTDLFATGVEYINNIGEIDRGVDCLSEASNTLITAEEDLNRVFNERLKNT